MSQDPKKTVSRESDKFMLRFPEGMRSKITELAQSNGRSMNAEIIARLEQTMGPATAGTSHAAPALLESFARLNSTLAEREFDLQGARNHIERLQEALYFAHRAIRTSPTAHQSLDQLDMIEDLIDVKTPPDADPMRHQKLREEKFKALRKAQQQVRDAQSTNAPPAKAD